jgi:mevalonate kinase
MSSNLLSPKVTEFSIEVPAKWVLVGEHSVLRGYAAIAMPYFAYTLSLSYRSGPEELTITANPFQSQIKSLLARACEWLHVSPEKLRGGELEIQSRIPIGAGLGSSAALCVAVSRFVLWKTQTDLQQWIPLATHLEDVFHGKSSGMDIHAIAHAQPILYSMAGGAQVLGDVRKFPRFELFDSGRRGLTRECIERVKAQPPMTAQLLDSKMGEATQMAREALKDYSLSALAQAMNQAQECFEAWGLVPNELIEQKNELLKQGALAVKLTGSGMGGFWVALWPDLDKPNSEPIVKTKH